MRLHTTLAACAVAALAACGTTAGLEAVESRSGFDGGRVVSVPGHGNACARVTCTGLGAQWRAAQPDRAVLTAHVFNEIRGITAIELSIDGEVTRYRPTPGLTNFTSAAGLRESRQDFDVPMQAVRAIAVAQRAWLRVHTTDGYLEDAIVDGAAESKALHALRRFVAQVDAGPR